MLSQRKLKCLLTDTIWIVPKETLLAYLTLNNISKRVIDQTIWIIDSYDKGYIFGTSYTIIDGAPLSKTKIVGSITPYGDVLLAFHSNNNITPGYGKFMKIDKEWQFVMQMNALANLAGNVIGLSHWSYMQRITSCDADYYHVPGAGVNVDISIPEVIKLFG